MIADAEVALIECASNPLDRDREGFTKRLLRRIELGRVFDVFDGDKLVFKAGIVAETDDVVYREGVYVTRKRSGGGMLVAALRGTSRPRSARLLA